MMIFSDITDMRERCPHSKAKILLVQRCVAISATAELLVTSFSSGCISRKLYYTLPLFVRLFVCNIPAHISVNECLRSQKLTGRFPVSVLKSASKRESSGLQGNIMPTQGMCQVLTKHDLFLLAFAPFSIGVYISELTST